MSPPRPTSDTVLVAYGLLAGGVRVVLPPVWDLPFVRTVRGSMFDRLARSSGVALTAEGRRVLIDLEEPTSTRGIAEQVARWAAARFVPGATVLDAGRNVLRTYAAGALFRRYLEQHRPEPRDPVINGLEAARVQLALRGSLHVLSVEHVRALARVVGAAFSEASTGGAELSVVQRYSDAVVETVTQIPDAWVDVMDTSFRAALDAPPNE